MNEIIVGSSADPVKQGLDKISANVKWRQNFYEQVHFSLGILWTDLVLSSNMYFLTTLVTMNYIGTTNCFLKMDLDAGFR